MLFVRNRCGGNTFYENGRVDVETAGEFDDVVKTEVASPTLDLPHKCPVHIRELSQRLLTDSKALAVCANSLAEYACCFRLDFRHGS
jgi:hypothetical protein